MKIEIKNRMRYFSALIGLNFLYILQNIEKHCPTCEYFEFYYFCDGIQTNSLMNVVTGKTTEIK